MSDRERLHRPDPVRTGPIRDISTLYRRADSWGAPPNGHAPSADEVDGGTYSDVVAQAVERGYQVVEEQIRQGQRIAEEVSRRTYDSGAMAGDLREVSDRAWRYVADLGALWTDYLGSLAGDGELMRKVFASWQPGGVPPPAAANGSAPDVAIDVSCDRAAQVSLDLRCPDARAVLTCQPLRALAGDPPALTDVVFTRAPDASLTVRIRVPEAQPAGVYIGAVVDAATMQSRGTLSVRLA